MKHPGYGREGYPTSTVLRDMASHNNNDGEPWDQMIEAADQLSNLTAASNTLWEACLAADVRGELPEDITGEMLDDLRAFLDVVDPILAKSR